jgi:SsrA-binding protein
MAEQKKINIKNKKALFNFEIIDTYTAGIVLTGTEVKSIRMGKASLGESYCYMHNGELWIKGMHISEYSFGSYSNHTPLRERKMLLKKKELSRIGDCLKVKGNTVVAIKLFLTPVGYVKMDIATARGKKTHDKREDLKTKDAKREMDRVKNRY